MKHGTLHVPAKAKRFASAAPGNLYAEQANNFFQTILHFFPDFDEVLRRAGLNRTELRKLETDDEIGAATDTRREAVIATGYHLEDAEGKPAEGEDVDFIQEQLDVWCECMARSAWAAVPFGYSVWETVYQKLPANRIGIAYLSEKPFEWFIPQQSGGLLYRPIDNPMGVEVDTVYKFFHTVREPSYRQPYGRALYSQLYWPWFYRKMGWQFWMKYLERWGVPFLVGHTANDVDAMAKNLAKMVQNATVAVGAEDKVDVLQSGTGTAGFEGFERAVTARVQKVILGQTLTTDAGGSSGKSGSFALGKVHNEVREDRRNADLRLIKRTIQRQVNALWSLNGFAGKPPLFTYEGDTDIQLDRAQRDYQLMNGGVRLAPSYFERVYDFEEGEVLDQVEPVAPADGTKPDTGEPEPAGAKAQYARVRTLAATGSPRFTKEQQAVEDLITASAAKLSSPIDPESIKNAIRAAKDPDDLIDRLAVLFQNQDAFSFAAIVERALFAGHVMGFSHATPKGNGS